LENAQQLARLGVNNTAGGRSLIAQHLEQAAQRTDNIKSTFTDLYGTYEVRGSLFAGPSGQFAKLESTWQILKDGTRRFVSLIPFGGP